MRRMPLLNPSVKRRLLAALGLSVAVPWLIGAWVKTTLQSGLHDDATRASQIVDFIVAGSVVFLIAMVVTAAVGCVVVAVMKGPHYIGDPFPQDESNGP
ncbi:hypothetical protein C1704_02080 [Caldimonas caldifontis]|uniref:Uncharacterized protein n=1 Tax=Caldimonas caldifontis TaxID=1452508 RepID=A0A2S5SY20_9BURK|nr:hypothetical protein C1704_02080 [Caldimonas caldifontis]